jgi:glutaminyl-peptide cyclotransferase
MHPAASSRANNLSSIDLLVLFDLLGTSGPRIPSYFPTTHWAYSSMSNVEKQLRSKDLLSTSKSESWLFEGEQYATNIYKGGIEDDHIPFLHRGVEILHIIPVQPLQALLTEIPFPREWHTIDVLFSPDLTNFRMTLLIWMQIQYTIGHSLRRNLLQSL